MATLLTFTLFISLGYHAALVNCPEMSASMMGVRLAGVVPLILIESSFGPMPGTVQSLEATPMGSSALYLVWKRPEQENGVLTGYKIYYQKVTGTKVGTLQEREPHVSDPTVTRAKLAGLEPGSKYRIHIAATTAAGEGEDYFIEQRTRGSQAIIPDVPTFHAEQIAFQNNNGYGNVKVTWTPNPDGKPGSHFYVKYRKVGEAQFSETVPEFAEDYQVVRGLEPDTNYEIKLVAVDGEYSTESELHEVEIQPTDGKTSPLIKPRQTEPATAGWFIGMMLAIAFLLLVLILVCIVKRNRGGKYAVHEREAAHGRHDYPDDTGFHEYSQPLDKSSHGRGSMNSEPKVGPESDTDSMAEYGEGDTEGMNEDGSFIGLYGKQKKQGETSSGGFATLV